MTFSKKILMLSPIPSHPRHAGHRERIYQLAQTMRHCGHDVHFLYATLETDSDIAAMKAYWGEKFHLFPYKKNRTPNRCSPSFHAHPAIKLLRKVGYRVGKEFNFPYRIDDWYDTGLDAFVRQLHQQYEFDVVMLEYLFLSKALDALPDTVLKIIDTIDRLSDRHKLYQHHYQPPQWFYTTPRHERQGLHRADILIAIQAQERQFFKHLVPEKQVFTVNHFVRLCPVSPNSAQARTILFLASDNPINTHGLRYFTHDILPQIHSNEPQTRFLIAGRICRALPESPRYTLLGEVNDTETVYAMADVVVSPIVFGTGLKIKNLEALGYAKPLVTTPTGAQGLDDGVAERAFFCAATAEEFASQVVELLRNPDLRRYTADRAYQYAARANAKNRDTLQIILSVHP